MVVPITGLLRATQVFWQYPGDWYVHDPWSIIGFPDEKHPMETSGFNAGVAAAGSCARAGSDKAPENTSIPRAILLDRINMTVVKRVLQSRRVESIID